jgi:DNA helicase II / ATP-dependent DNA helicase PcrA
MKLDDYFAALRDAHGGNLPLNADQEHALRHDYAAPLWIIAGPGTGKTHTLVWLTFKRILVDGVKPDAIVLTTFTRKAAAELESRMITARERLLAIGVREAEQVDVAQMLLGTLHSLCSRVLQDQRYEPTLHVRVLEDELSQQFFIRRSHNPLLKCDDVAFWQRFDMAVERGTIVYAPSSAGRAECASKLFNRITENSADLTMMRASGDPHLVALAEAYEAYEVALSEERRTDQAHLQAHFLAFLRSAEGQGWLAEPEGKGRGMTVVVDEYQDTNPIQEAIYFALAERSGDLTVVGDDDQSLYRFRGATVESLIDFDHACLHYLGTAPAQVNLRENRRSHPKIVDWVNRYIEHHPRMTDPDPTIRVRAPQKRSLVPQSSINGPYPAVMAIAEKNNPRAARSLVQAIKSLKDDGLVSDYSQIALLAFSTRETSHAIGTFTRALREAGIPLYNPRNGTAQKDQIFLAMLGAIMEILDPDEAELPAALPSRLSDYIKSARNAFRTLMAEGNYGGLQDYVSRSGAAIRKTRFNPAEKYNYLTRQGGRRVSISQLLYKLLAHEPFVTSMQSAEAGERLKALNLILADYESLYSDGELRITQDESGVCAIEPWTLYNLYAVFVEGIHDRLNDPEDDEVSVQPGMVNVMTIHQSKGLEFEVVFVLRPDTQPWVSDTHTMEDVLEPFISRPTKPRSRRSRELRAAEDTARLFFVAYSRAKRLLVLTGSNIQNWSEALGQAPTGIPLTTTTALKAEGVHVL